MNPSEQNETVVKEGVFLYDGRVECDVRILHSPIRYGSGDYEDPSEIENELEQVTYYLQFGSTTERGVFNAGGGAYPSLAQAVAAAEAAPGIGATIRWHHNEASA
jgi:hypothetical protein